MPNRPFSRPLRSQRSGQITEWLPSDTQESLRKNPERNKWKGVDIRYSFNSDGYRSEDFALQPQGPRVLFSGCSLTEGVGLRLEDVWSHRMIEKINDTFQLDIPFWSVAVGGTGLDQQHRALFQHIDKLKPNLLFLQISELTRRERWDGDHFGPWSEDLEEREWRGFLDDRYVAFQTSRDIALIDDLLVRNKTKCCVVAPIIDEEREAQMLQSFFPESWYFCRKLFDRFDLARDGIHFGPVSHRVWTQNIWDDISDKLPSWLGI